MIIVDEKIFVRFYYWLYLVVLIISIVIRER